MASLINVNGSDDPSYRYKMPKLIGKIEGRGNGIKTVIVNCSDIAQALRRPSGQVTKFFGCELGAMSKYEEKIDRSLVNGAFETNDLQDILTKYIEKFVLCPSCGNPETVMEVRGKKKSALILLSCKACGAVEEADNSHKLCTYILKEMTGPEKGSTKEERRRRKKEREAASNNGSVDEEGDKKSKKKSGKKKDKDRDEDSEKERKRRKKKRKEKKNAEKAERHMDKQTPEDSISSGNSDDDEAKVPTDSFGVMSIDDVAIVDTIVDGLQESINSGKEPEVIVEETGERQTKSGLLSKDCLSIYFFASVCNQSGKVIMKYLPAIKKFVESREDQFEVIGCLEESVIRAEPSKTAVALTLVPLILKTLYDSDIVEEEVILEWFSGNFKYKHTRALVADDVVTAVKANAQPLVNWLKEADSEEESEEEADE